MMIEQQSKKIDTWKLVNYEALSIALAEDAWKQDTKDVPEADLYETMEVEGIWGPEIKKEIASKWAYLFINLKESYSQLIEEYVKK